jgi:hypothetical protein
MVALGRRTLTGLLVTSGHLWNDWTADYRVLSQARVDPEPLWGVVRREILQQLPPSRPLLVALDDTTSRKRGRHIPGAAWLRDPLGPPFGVTLLWGRRFLQCSALLPTESPAAPPRAIPIQLLPLPHPAKPSRKAPPEAWSAYHHARRTQTLTRLAALQIQHLRTQVDQDGAPERALWIVADGSYTNRTVVRTLPARTTFIGRLRADAVLHQFPSSTPPRGPGRRPTYGPVLPTPEAFRQEETLPWTSVPIVIAGQQHAMRIKTIGPVLWRAAGSAVPLVLIVVAPLGYRLTRRSRLLYRRPAYLICTDPTLPPAEILAAYVARWDIEVNFRDEKSLLGLDEAQVRTPVSAHLAPTLAVLAYAFLLLAATRAFGSTGGSTILPLPKWRQAAPPRRLTTPQLMNQLRFELWASALHPEHFSDFVTTPPPRTNSLKFRPPLASALFYAQSAN